MLATLEAEAGRPLGDRAIRDLRCGNGSGQRLLRVERPCRAGTALSGADGAGWRRRPQAARRGLHSRTVPWHASNGRRGDRHRPPDYAADGLAFDTRRHPFSAAAAGRWRRIIFRRTRRVTYSSNQHAIRMARSPAVPAVPVPAAGAATVHTVFHNLRLTMSWC